MIIIISILSSQYHNKKYSLFPAYSTVDTYKYLFRPRHIVVFQLVSNAAAPTNTSVGISFCSSCQRFEVSCTEQSLDYTKTFNTERFDPPCRNFHFLPYITATSFHLFLKLQAPPGSTQSFSVKANYILLYIYIF